MPLPPGIVPYLTYLPAYIGRYRISGWVRSRKLAGSLLTPWARFGRDGHKEFFWVRRRLPTKSIASRGNYNFLACNQRTSHTTLPILYSSVKKCWAFVLLHSSSLQYLVLLKGPAITSVSRE